jgi:GNAT superfamily N-acetyltransferase
MDAARLQIRKADAEDVAGLAAVQLESALTAFADIFPDSVAKPLPGELEEEWSALVFDRRTTVLVAELSDELVGGVAFGDVPALAPAGYALLAKLYVHPDHFGAGVGTRLYDAAIDGLREGGRFRIWLWVLEGNLPAKLMYERRGWVAQPERRTDWPGSGVYEMGYALEINPSAG